MCFTNIDSQDLLRGLVDIDRAIVDTKPDSEKTRVVKRALNSFSRQRRSSETSGKSPAEEVTRLTIHFFFLVLRLLSLAIPPRM